MAARWPAQISSRQGKHALVGRLCVARKGHAAIELAKTEAAQQNAPLPHPVEEVYC